MTVPCRVVRVLRKPIRSESRGKPIWWVPVEYRSAVDSGRTKLLFYSLDEALAVTVGTEFS